MTINADKLLAFDSGDVPVDYRERDCILYALSIGIGMDPCDASDLRFVYEKDLAAFPTMATILGWPGRMTDPAFGIDHRKVVAADMDVQWLQPLPPHAGLSSRARVAEIIDKGPGKAAVIVMERTLRDRGGLPVAIVRNGILALGQGGFGVTAMPRESQQEPRQEPQKLPHVMPSRPADLSCDLKTPPNLALLFRLHGDDNPIHVDPSRAAAAGFRAPLLHGSANFGIAAHALLRSAMGGDATRFKRMRARFAKPFFPGETLRTEMWVDGMQVTFRCLSVERGEAVLDDGLLEMHAEGSSR